MKKSLTRVEKTCWYFDASGKRVIGTHLNLWGNVSGLWGNVSGLWGDVSDLRGNASNLIGDVSGLRGDFDDCDITDDERLAGMNVDDLVNCK
jgi:hypothetical protein